MTEIFEKNRYNGQRGGCNVSVGRYNDCSFRRYKVYGRHSQGFSEEGASNDNGAVENVDFQSFRTPHQFGVLRNKANIVTQSLIAMMPSMDEESLCAGQLAQRSSSVHSSQRKSCEELIVCFWCRVMHHTQLMS